MTLNIRPNVESCPGLFVKRGVHDSDVTFRGLGGISAQVTSLIMVFHVVYLDLPVILPWMLTGARFV